MLNPALANEVAQRVLNPQRALITSSHVVEQCGPLGGVGERGGFGRCGMRLQMVSFPERWCCHQGAQHFRTDVQPTGHEHLFSRLLSWRCAVNHPQLPSFPLEEATDNHRGNVERGGGYGFCGRWATDFAAAGLRILRPRIRLQSPPPPPPRPTHQLVVDVMVLVSREPVMS